MAAVDLFSLRNIFQEQGVMICFNGPFSHSVIEELGKAVKRYLQSEEAPKDRVADIFSVFVEQAQNLKNYTAREDLSLPADSAYRSGTLLIGREAEHYVINSGNIVHSEDAETIKTRLEDLNDMDNDELRRLYKKRLREPIQEGQGPGLGFITMARKAAEPIRYSFREVEESLYFFNIAVLV
jgi:hypothetical protein